ncbi:MAG: hypothetical protein IJU44_00420 [Kiritimatiellae bacterium]|nr:hypothetical protein [Kiritimatiellia bacterium]
MNSRTAIFLFSLAAGCLAVAEEEKAVAKNGDSFDWDLGADLRVRQEIMDNIPGHPGDPDCAYPTASGKNLNWIRFRPRVWSRFSTEHADFYLRLANETRETIARNGNSRRECSYSFPDELVVDNLYLGFRNLFDDQLDIRIGRQDFLDNGAPAFGSGRVMMDGTGYDGSRTLSFDAIRLTWRPTEKQSLDAFAIYNRGDNQLNLGRPRPYPRPANAFDPRDSDEMDEYGGGLYYRNRELSDDLGFELYYVYKRETSYHRGGVRHPGRYTNTFGGRLLPRFTETLSGEIEGALQAGQKETGASTAGAMGFAGLTYRPEETIGTAKPFFKASCYYLSGDKQRTGDNDRDSGWNPVWARWPQDSEMLVYGPLYGLGYWSNMIFPSAGAGLDIAKHHRVNIYGGPMFCATQDHLGGGNGSDYQGVLGVARYDFPIWKNPNEGGIGEIFGHILAECFQPGDYYASDRTAYFFRWEIYATF